MTSKAADSLLQLAAAGPSLGPVLDATQQPAQVGACAPEDAVQVNVRDANRTTSSLLQLAAAGPT